MKYAKRILALALSLVLLLPLSAMPAKAEAPAVLRVALISDPHFFPEEMAGGYGQAFKDGQMVGHPIEQTPGLLRSALAAIKARKNEIDFLLIPGDLTREGEYIGHVRLAELLAAFEAETGIPVAVVPGNHDINNGGASDFSNQVKEKARETTYDDFYDIYKKLGYDLPNCARFAPAGEDTTGRLSYAADLGSKYRLVALDTKERRITPELRAWAVDQCKKAVKAGKTVVGMGHHNLNEQLRGQLIVMQNQGIGNMREISEELAGAGMHFYFSGHLHMSEISPWYSDKGEVLYDIIVPGLYSFPGDYRVVNFSALGGRIEADINSYPVDEVLAVTSAGVTYDRPYYKDNLEISFGGEGGGMAGFTKANARQELGKQLRELKASGGIAAKVKGSVDFAPLNALMAYLDKQLIDDPERILALIDKMIDDAFALPVSKLPCTRFIDELGFGDECRPGTVGDLATSALVYMFWKKHDPADDPFMQDVLRRLKNGELLDQLLNYALPMVFDLLGEELLPLLANVDINLVNRALQTALGPLSFPLIFILTLVPGTRNTISTQLYKLASEIITSASPTGSGDGLVVYDGPVSAPAGSRTFRLPYDISVTVSRDCKSAEVTWYTKASLTSPELIFADAGIEAEITTEIVDITVEEVNLGVMKLLGHTMRAAKHTAAVTGLKPLRAYQFNAGDSRYGWYSPQKTLFAAWDNPLPGFFAQVLNWFLGMLRLPAIMWNNRGYYLRYW